MRSRAEVGDEPRLPAQVVQELFALDLTDPAQRLVLELELTAAASGR